MFFFTAYSSTQHPDVENHMLHEEHQIISFKRNYQQQQPLQEHLHLLLYKILMIIIKITS